jgi:hypothetical protein
MGFEVSFIRWVMRCISTVSFVVLINGSTSPFFHSEKGLIQGCPLSPLLFLLMVEGLSRVIGEAKRSSSFPGIQISNLLKITHLLFVDDLIFCDGTRRDVESLANIMSFFLGPLGCK